MNPGPDGPRTRVSESESARPYGGGGAGGLGERRARRRTWRLIRKVVVTILGALILAAGVAMLALPGPGLLGIALGLLVLSTEYEWASSRLDQARDKALDTARASASNPWSTAGAVISSLGLIAAGVVAGTVDGLPLVDSAANWWTGVTLIVSGLIALATIVWSIHDLRRHRAGAGT